MGQSHRLYKRKLRKDWRCHLKSSDRLLFGQYYLVVSAIVAFSQCDPKVLETSGAHDDTTVPHVSPRCGLWISPGDIVG